MCDQVADGLINKSVTFRKLDKPEEAIAVYDELDRRFGKDESLGLGAQAAKARNGLAFNQTITAKQQLQIDPETKRCSLRRSDC